MVDTAISYVFQTADGGWRIVGSRVSLDSVVYAYWDGRSPETIAEEFPTLSLEQIHGALAFYLRYRAEIDRYLESQDERWRQLQQESEAAHGSLLKSLRARRTMPSHPEKPLDDPS
jgi:uncharacterized protein (DUF433 family)